MDMNGYDWNSLYKKAEEYMKKVHTNDCKVIMSQQTIFEEEPIITVEFPKRNNMTTLIELENNSNCIRFRGNKKNGLYFVRYGLKINHLI